MLELVAKRGTSTACPSEVARAVGGTAWRELMPAVRAAAARLQQRGKLDVFQRGRPVDVATARGPVRLRTRDVDVDHRAHPERYVIGRGEEGVLTVEPYRSELLPLWRFRTPAVARTSARALLRAFEAYGEAGDFVGMDMARKFLQMGFTRARRYANRASGRKYDAGGALLPLSPDAEKAESAAIFRRAWERARTDPTYLRLRAAFVGEAPPPTRKPVRRAPRHRGRPVR